MNQLIRLSVATLLSVALLGGCGGSKSTTGEKAKPHEAEVGNTGASNNTGRSDQDRTGTSSTTPDNAAGMGEGTGTASDRAAPTPTGNPAGSTTGRMPSDTPPPQQGGTTPSGGDPVELPSNGPVGKPR